MPSAFSILHPPTRLITGINPTALSPHQCGFMRCYTHRSLKQELSLPIMSSTLPPTNTPRPSPKTGKARRLGLRYLVRGCLITFAFALVAGCALSSFGIIALARTL